jgi:hypothetical protein
VIILGEGADFTQTAASAAGTITSSGGLVSWTANRITYTSDGVVGQFLNISAAVVVTVEARELMNINHSNPSLAITVQGVVTFKAPQLELANMEFSPVGSPNPFPSRLLIDANSLVFQNLTIFGSGGYVKINANKILSVGDLELNCQGSDSSFSLQCVQYSGSDNIILTGGFLGHIGLDIGYLSLNFGGLSYTGNGNITDVRVNEMAVSFITTSPLGQHKITANKITLTGSLTQDAMTGTGSNVTIESNEITSNSNIILEGCQNAEACVSFKVCRVFVLGDFTMGITAGGALLTHTNGSLNVDVDRTDTNQSSNSVFMGCQGVGSEMHLKLGRLSHSGAIFARINTGGLIHMHDTQLDSTVDTNPGNFAGQIQGAVVNPNDAQYLFHNCTFRGVGQCDINAANGGTYRYYNCNFYTNQAQRPFILVAQGGGGPIRAYFEGCLFRTNSTSQGVNIQRVAAGPGGDHITFKSCHFETTGGGSSVNLNGAFAADRVFFTGSSANAGISGTAPAATVVAALPLTVDVNAVTLWEPPF